MTSACALQSRNDLWPDLLLGRVDFEKHGMSARGEEGGSSLDEYPLWRDGLFSGLPFRELVSRVVVPFYVLLLHRGQSDNAWD
jgi:hypothetical protein